MQSLRGYKRLRSKFMEKSGPDDSPSLDLDAITVTSQQYRSRASFLSSIARIRPGSPQLPSAGTYSGPYFGPRRPRFKVRHLLYSLSVRCLIIFGLLKVLSYGFSTFLSFFPDELDFVIDHWGETGQSGEGLTHWPTDFTHGARPIQCHSHNDYSQDVPLYEAIRFGCISVEADIWLMEEGLLVGHTIPSLTRNRTLSNLYINPLMDVIDRQNSRTESSQRNNNDLPPVHGTLNGVFDTRPDQTLVLLLDFKADGEALWPHVREALEPLRRRDYLTHWDGTIVHERPITIVATGDAPYPLLSSTSLPRTIFFDAPLSSFAQTTQNTTGSAIARPSDPSLPPYTAATSYYASTSFKATIGRMWKGSPFAPTQLAAVRAQIEGAHAAGLKVRYCGIPAWPRGLRNHVWHVLMREGVDVLNTDDLKGATMRDWRRRKGWWF